MTTGAYAMTAYTNLRARYSKGILKLTQRLDLPENAEVRVTVTAVGEAAPALSKTHWNSVAAVPPGTLRRLDGIVALGGDAVADSDALYDSD
jgi:predicted DNA-binding antitoxin AbrB/MazE fold protein